MIEVPTCSDGVKNQQETGIDCGGSCPPCQATAEEPCPNGCVYIGADGLEICMNIGQTSDTVYCSKDGQVKLKKSNARPCEKGYECNVGICDEGKCGKHVTIATLILNIIALILFFGVLFYVIDTIIKNA